MTMAVYSLTCSNDLKWRNVVSCCTATTAGFLKKFYFFAREYCSYQMINA